jgi:hypothetical protein
MPPLTRNNTNSEECSPPSMSWVRFEPKVPAVERRKVLRALQNQSRSYVTIDGQSASLSGCQAPIWGPKQDFYYCQTVAGLLKCGALTGERTGLSFTIAVGTRQRSQSWVRVPQDSWPYLTISGSRLSQPGGPGPHPPRSSVIQLYPHGYCGGIRTRLRAGISF